MINCCTASEKLLLCLLCRIILKCFHAEADLSVFAVEVNNLSRDLLSDGKYIGWFRNMLSGDLGYMKQCIYARLPAQQMHRNLSYVQLYLLQRFLLRYFSAAVSHGFSSGNFRLRAILSPLMSLIRTFSFSPTLNTFFGFSTLPQDISEM